MGSTEKRIDLSTALAEAATEFAALELQVVAQYVQQWRVVRRLYRVLGAVDAEAYWFG